MHAARHEVKLSERRDHGAESPYSSTETMTTNSIKSTTSTSARQPRECVTEEGPNIEIFAEVQRFCMHTTINKKSPSKASFLSPLLNVRSAPRGIQVY